MKNNDIIKKRVLVEMKISCFECTSNDGGFCRNHQKWYSLVRDCRKGIKLKISH